MSGAMWGVWGYPKQGQVGAVGRALPVLTLWCALLVPPATLATDGTTLGRITDTVTHVVSRGDTLAKIMASHGVGASEVQSWWRAARPKRDLSKLAIGHEIELSFSAERRLISLGYSIDDEERLIVERDAIEGAFRTRVEEQNVFVTPTGARGRISNSFFGAAQAAGIPEAVISEMVDILSVRLNFDAQVRPGDRFRVL